MDTWLQYVAFLFVLICLAKPAAAFRGQSEHGNDINEVDGKPDSGTSSKRK